MTTRGNLKHQAAVAAAGELVDALRLDIHRELEVLRDIAETLEELTSTRQSVGLGFLTEDARTARDKQARADREAARGTVGRIEEPGLVWMNTTTVLGTGQVAAPVTMTAVSALVEIQFALQHQVRRLARPAAIAAAAAVPGGKGRLPLGLPTTDTDIAGLTRELDDLVDVYTSRQGLDGLLRDLDRLEATAREVTDGPARTNHPEVCPWCGRNSLVIHHREKGRDTQLIRCEGKHPCECTYEWCDCHRNPIRNRHEWVNSGRAAHTWHQLHNLQTKRKELAVMETQALDAIERIRALHSPIQADGELYLMVAPQELVPLDHDCAAAGNQDVDGIGCRPTWNEHLIPGCVGCRIDTEDGAFTFPYPCPTIRAIDPPETD